MNWLDIVIILVVIIGCIDGLNKGFVVSVINMLRLIISLIAAKLLSPFFAGILINSTSLHAKLTGLFDKKLSVINPTTLGVISIITDKREGLSRGFAAFLINIIAFIVIFALVSSLLIMARDTIRGIIKRTPVRFLDNIGGLGIGLVKSLLFLFILFALLSPLMVLLPQDNFLATAVLSSSIAKYFLTYNIITPLINVITGI